MSDFLKRLLNNEPIIGGEPKPGTLQRSDEPILKHPTSLEALMQARALETERKAVYNQEKFGSRLEPPSSLNKNLKRRLAGSMNPLPAYFAVDKKDGELYNAALDNYVDTILRKRP